MADKLENVVLNYMKQHNGITSYEAYELGATRLSAIIYNLRSKGYMIDNDWQQSTNRYGAKVRYVRYVLAKEFINE